MAHTSSLVAKVKILFTHINRIMKLDHLWLRNPKGTTDELTLAVTAQNLQRIVKLLPKGPPLTG